MFDPAQFVVLPLHYTPEIEELIVNQDTYWWCARAARPANMWSASIHVAGEQSPNVEARPAAPWIPLLEHERPDDAPSADAPGLSRPRYTGSPLG
jgi:hypothetical protein